MSTSNTFTFDIALREYINADFCYLNSYLMILCEEAGPLLAFVYICILWIYQYIQYIIVILEFSQFM